MMQTYTKKQASKNLIWRQITELLQKINNNNNQNISKKQNKQTMQANKINFFLRRHSTN